MEDTSEKNRILLFSCRGLTQYLANAAIYEFEDSIIELENVDVIAPTDDVKGFPEINLRHKVERVVHHATNNWGLSSSVARMSLKKHVVKDEYDLFLAVLPQPTMMLYLQSVRGIHEKCRVAACYIPETWITHLNENPGILNWLKNFNRLFVSTVSSVDFVSNLTGIPCEFLPFGVDALLFSNDAENTERPVRAYNLGRRDPAQHEALLDYAAHNGVFYDYDTGIGRNSFSTHKEHRMRYANLLRSCRYFVCNRANLDEAWKTGGAEEIGHRFFEGAAAGAIMLGEAGRDALARSGLDWPDVLVDAPMGGSAIRDVVRTLDADPDRRREISLRNMVNTVSRHDWVFRWEAMLKALGLRQPASLGSRKALLQARSKQIEAGLTQTPKEASFAG
ncbi:MAG: glycosyltransferase [Pseudomonadota bacterium]